MPKQIGKKRENATERIKIYPSTKHRLKVRAAQEGAKLGKNVRIADLVDSLVI